MKYDIGRLETMGFGPGRDLCMVRVRPDDDERVDEFLRIGQFPYLYGFGDREKIEGMEYTVAGYFFDTTKEMAKETTKNFPFRYDGALKILVYEAAAMGLAYLREKLEKTLYNKIREKVFKVLDKKDWEEEVATMKVVFPPEITKEAGRNMDLPREIAIKAGIRMIERVLKSDALTVLDWRQKETGYQDGILAFDNFEQNYEYLTFTARAKGDPVKRLSIVTSDEENEDLYISWAVLRTKEDLKEEDDIEPEIWVAHNGKIYSDQDDPPVSEMEEFDVEEQVIINQEIRILRKRFEEWCQE